MVKPYVETLIDELKQKYPDAKLIKTFEEVMHRIVYGELKPGKYIIQYANIHAFAHDSVAFRRNSDYIDILFENPVFRVVVINIK